MPAVTFTSALAGEYETLFNTCAVRPDRAAAVERIADRLLAQMPRYRAVGEPLGIPWYFIAVVHNMESGQRFDRHLHNGDPLTARTVQVPRGRPASGTPPFQWEESATDALMLRRLERVSSWSLTNTLYQLEAYNGFGYRLQHPHVRSPYLWSYSSHYTSGKYIADGRWSDTAVSQQCGAAVVLRRLAERGEIDFADQPAPVPGAMPLIPPFSNRRSGDPAIAARAGDLQRWLNTFPGIFVLVDDVPGTRTSDAYRTVTGQYLPGDPRA